MLEIGKRIAKERKLRDWSQHELTQQLKRVGFNCTTAYIGMVERGRSTASKELLKGLERAFDLRLGAFLQYAALDNAEKFCSETKIGLSDYMKMIDMASRRKGGSREKA